MIMYKIIALILIINALPFTTIINKKYVLGENNISINVQYHFCEHDECSGIYDVSIEEFLVKIINREDEIKKMFYGVDEINIYDGVKVYVCRHAAKISDSF